MISQCFGLDNFYSSFISNKKPLVFYYDIWDKVLIEIMEMWQESMNYNYNPNNNPRNNKLRIQRIETGVLSSRYNGYSFESIRKLTMVINGEECISLDDAFVEIKKISNPKFGVTCHGDPQPSNIIISDDSSNWYLVDWEWSGHNHDFRLMFSHLYGWWATRLINIIERPEFIIRDNKIIINYKTNYSKVISKFQHMSKSMLIKNFDITQEDIDNVNRFLALLYLGDLRFLNVWGRMDYLPVLIGEAIKTICFINKKSIKVNPNFTFEME